MRSPTSFFCGESTTPSPTRTTNTGQAISWAYPLNTRTSRTPRYEKEGSSLTLTTPHKREVIVIGPNVAEALFPNHTSVVGTIVTMEGRPFEIIGVLEKRKNTFFGRERRRQLPAHPF